MRTLFVAVSLFLPPGLKRFWLRHTCGFELAPGSRIGISWINPRTLSMESGACIGHLTVCKGVEHLRMGANSSIGNLNWITGFPKDLAGHFEEEKKRECSLLLGREAAVTHRHYLDATGDIAVGEFSTVAGIRSQILTHTIDLRKNRQSCRPVRIGARCFVGTGCVVLPGATLPDRCVLGALSLLKDAFDEEGVLYAGNPAEKRAGLDVSEGYFVRQEGFVR
jgi:acetyltransferase-like isoleucine patch superfamily enzyme